MIHVSSLLLALFHFVPYLTPGPALVVHNVRQAIPGLTIVATSFRNPMSSYALHDVKGEWKTDQVNVKFSAKDAPPYSVSNNTPNTYTLTLHAGFAAGGHFSTYLYSEGPFDIVSELYSAVVIRNTEYGIPYKQPVPRFDEPGWSDRVFWTRLYLVSFVVGLALLVVLVHKGVGKLANVLAQAG